MYSRDVYVKSVGHVEGIHVDSSVCLARLCDPRLRFQVPDVCGNVEAACEA